MHLPAILTMAHLKKSGALGPDAPLLVGIDIGVRLAIYPEGDRFLIQVPKTARANEFKNFNSLKQEDFDIHVVRYVWRERNFGERPYFICPLTGRDCIKLMVDRGVLASPAGYREHIAPRGRSATQVICYADIRAKLLKLEGTQRLSLSSRKEIVRKLKRYPHWADDDPEMLAFLAQEERRDQRSETKLRWEQRSLSTTQGLDRGRSAGQDAVLEEEFLGRHQSHWLETIDRVSIPEQKPPPLSIEAVPELDINVLLERDWFKTGELRTRWLGWPRESTGGRNILLIADRRDPDQPLLFARSSGENWRDGKWQRIGLARGPKSKRPRFFVCPLTDRRCEKLYRRQDIFASREVLNLYYPSQRARRLKK